MIHIGLWLTGMIFTILKFAEAVTWSWWIVMSPFIISAGWFVVSIILVALIAAVLTTHKVRKKK